MTLEVLQPGLASLIVDRGRPSSRARGLPVSGPADLAAFTLGNALVGNPLEAAALEVALTGPTLRATQPVGAVVFGAPFSLESDRQSLVMGRTFTLEIGETLRLRGTPHGARAYLCVRGGIQAPVVQASRCGMAPLRAGDLLPCLPSRVPVRWAALSPEEDEWALVRPPPVQLRVLDGAQANWFAPGELFGPAEISHSFRVTPAANRMGIRLSGPVLGPISREMVSEPVCPGSLQVTRDGQGILLGPDGQTIGGYPRIAQVIRADLDRIGQLRPGDLVRFEQAHLEHAEEAARLRRRWLDRWQFRLRTVASFAD